MHRYESRFERWRPRPRPGAWREETPPERGGGVLLDLGAHLVDQALRLFGPVRDVYGEVAARRGGAADDDSFVALRHESGVESHLWASSVAAAPGPRLRVLGGEGAYVVDGVDGQEAALAAGERPRPGEPWGREPPQRWGRLVVGDASEPVPSEPGDWPRFYAELEAALRDGAPPPVDPADAVTVLELLERARRSAAPSLDLARAVSSVGRALPLQGRGRRFEPGTAHLTQSNSRRCRPEAHQSRRRVETVALYSVFNPSAGAGATSSLASRFATRSPG